MVQFRFRRPSSFLPYFSPTRYISHTLILISVVIAILGFSFPDLISYFGLHRISLVSETIPYLFGQVFLYQFLHGNVLHIFLNAYFLYQAGPEVEARMTKKEYMLFFLGCTLFVAVSLWMLSPMSLTIGISGFCMALLAYLYMDLQNMHHPMADQILIMLIINILIGLTGNISFVGHLAGAVWGVVWWWMRKK